MSSRGSSKNLVSGAEPSWRFLTGEHSSFAGVRNGVQCYGAHNCDTIVAVGGDLPIDASKAILYHNQKEVGGQTPSQIAIPTTLSVAGFTVRFGARLTNEEVERSEYLSQQLAPAGIILDAELTLATPTELILATPKKLW